jgi:hypothetical protein
MNYSSFSGRFSMGFVGVALTTLGIMLTAPATKAADIYSHIEDFEDGALNTPGVTAIGGSVLGPGGLTDSVEGANPGSGSTGYSYYSNGSNLLRFNFDKVALGGFLPTTAGVTWTDVGYVTGDVPGSAVPDFTGSGTVRFRAYSESNALLTTISHVLGDGKVTGETDEDSIFAYTDLAGIGAITIEMGGSVDWEVDDLRYSAAKAVPTPALLPGLLGLGLTMWRKRNGKTADLVS